MVDLDEAQRHLLNQESGPYRLTLLKAIDELYAARAELTTLRAKVAAGEALQGKAAAHAELRGWAAKLIKNMDHERTVDDACIVCAASESHDGSEHYDSCELLGMTNALAACNEVKP